MLDNKEVKGDIFIYKKLRIRDHLSGKEMIDKSDRESEGWEGGGEAKMALKG